MSENLTGNQPENCAAQAPELRPLPRYGEYAPMDAAAGVTIPSAVVAAGTDTQAAGPPFKRAPRRWDQILTAALLGYAAISVVSQLATRDTLESALKQLFVSQGWAQYTPTALATSLGSVLNFASLGIFLVTLLASTWMLRRGRMAFWVPLAGGALATIATLVIVAVVLNADPTFVAHLRELRG